MRKAKKRFESNLEKGICELCGCYHQRGIEVALADGWKIVTKRGQSMLVCPQIHITHKRLRKAAKNGTLWILFGGGRSRGGRDVVEKVFKRKRVGKQREG